MLSFFNEVDVSSDDPRVAAAQYFATKGFFTDYNARLDEALTEAVKAVWEQKFEDAQNAPKLWRGPKRPVQSQQAKIAAKRWRRCLRGAGDAERADLVLA